MINTWSTVTLLKACVKGRINIVHFTRHTHIHALNSVSEDLALFVNALISHLKNTLINRLICMHEDGTLSTLFDTRLIHVKGFQVDCDL